MGRNSLVIRSPQVQVIKLIAEVDRNEGPPRGAIRRKVGRKPMPAPRSTRRRAPRSLNGRDPDDALPGIATEMRRIKAGSRRVARHAA